MIKNKLFLSLGTLGLAASLGFATIAPASADQAAVTRNTILGAAALIAGIAIESNVANKNAQAAAQQSYYDNGWNGNGWNGNNRNGWNGNNGSNGNGYGRNDQGRRYTNGRG
jgi:hypothetical protein